MTIDYKGSNKYARSTTSDPGVIMVIEGKI